MFDSFLEARENTSAWHLALDFTGASLNFEAQKKGLRPNRLWLLGKNQNYSGLAIARDWIQIGCSPRPAALPLIQATSCGFVSAYRKILQIA
jgi:hypothetical protein